MSNFSNSTVWRSGFRRLLVVAVFTLLAAIVLQSSRAGTSTKPYTAVFAPSGSRVTLTLTNGSSNQSLGSANVTVGKNASGGYLPVTFATNASAFAFTPAQASASATASWDPSILHTIDLRNLNLAPGGQVVFTMTSLNPCSSGTYTWGIVAKQSNDFNGPPGNNFTPTSTTLTTTLTAHCALTWDGGTEPASAFQGHTITGSMYDDASSSKVQVRLKDTSTGDTVTSAGGTVTLTPKDVTGCPTGTSFANVTASLSGGFATFDHLAGNDIATGCQLIASDTTDGYVSSDPSDPFNISYGTPCTDTGCPTTSGQLDSNSKLDASATGSSFMFLAFNASSIPSAVTQSGGGCYGFQSVFGSSGVAFDEVDGGGTGTKTFRYYVDKKLVQKKFGNNSGQQFIPICAGGAQVQRNTDGTTTILNCNDHPLLAGWMGKQIDSTGNFIDGAYKRAVCDPGSGLWWGILASFQDYSSGVIDPSNTPNVTGWNSDTTYRWFDISVPSPWDWRAQG